MDRYRESKFAVVCEAQGDVMRCSRLPLLKRDGLPELAREIMDELKWDTSVTYDEKDAVGRRYRRQDAIGTPFCITVDHQSLEDKTVTIRHRDTMKQERVAIFSLKETILSEVGLSNWLKKLQQQEA